MHISPISWQQKHKFFPNSGAHYSILIRGAGLETEHWAGDPARSLHKDIRDKMMTVSAAPAFDNHELVAFCNDSASGLRGIIAIHNTRLGPAVGGCRMFPYADEAEALHDVLRLSRFIGYSCDRIFCNQSVEP